MARENNRDIRIGRSGPGLIEGVENTRSALQNRLLTPYRSIPFFPEYGSALKQFQNLTINRENIGAVATEVERSLRRDPRIVNVDEVRAEGNEDGSVKIQAFIRLRGNTTTQLEARIGT